MEIQTPKNSYNYEAHYCQTADDVQRLFNENKDKIGFYPYFLPQAKGAIIILATINMEEAAKRNKPRIFQGLKPLDEAEARRYISQSIGGYFSEEQINIIASRIYEDSLVLCHKVDMKEENP